MAQVHQADLLSPLAQRPRPAVLTIKADTFPLFFSQLFTLWLVFCKFASAFSEIHYEALLGFLTGLPMDIFDQRSLSRVPIKARRRILLLLALVMMITAAIVVSLAIAGVAEAIVLVFVEILKVLALALVIWSFFLLVQKARSRDDLLRSISVILEQEIPLSFHSYAKIIPSFKSDISSSVTSNAESSNATAKADSELKGIDVAHLPGTTQARYRFEWFGQALTVYVQLNVKRISVIYYLPESFEAEVDSVFSATCIGARSAGWQMENYGKHRSDRIGENISYCELAALRDLGDDFIHDPAERLFITNDLAAMTRNVALNLSRAEKRVDA